MTQPTGGGWLGVEAGSRRFLIDLAQAGEILPVPSIIVRVPFTREWFLGMVNLRGTLHGVSDLAGLLGLAPTPLTREARLITFSAASGLNAAIIVGRMSGLQSAASPLTDTAAPVPAGRPGWMRGDWCDSQGQVWTAIDLAVLAADEAFLRVVREPGGPAGSLTAAA
jgi:twitching motility protein PilI